MADEVVVSREKLAEFAQNLTENQKEGRLSSDAGAVCASIIMLANCVMDLRTKIEAVTGVGRE